MTDAVVVGGGIGGAVLALALAQGGRRSIVLERAAAPSRAGRPEILWPATTTALDGLGVGGVLRADALTPLIGVEIRVAGAGGDTPPLLVLGEGTLRHASDPLETRALILHAAETTGLVEVRRGVDVSKIEFGDDGVVVEGVRAAVVVGDDGAASRVREALGIGLETRLFPVEFAGVEIEAPEVPREIGRAWIDAAAVASGLFGVIAIPLPRGRAAIVCLFAPDTWRDVVAAGAGAFRARAAAIAPPLTATFERAEFPADFVHVRRPVGHADRYVAARAALLGDAAHPMSPAGGQGANAAIADGLALAAVLLERFRDGEFSADALGAYERARRAANERSLAFSRRGAAAIRTVRAFPPARLVAGAAVALLRRSPGLQRHLVEAFATAFIGEPVRSR